MCNTYAGVRAAFYNEVNTRIANGGALTLLSIIVRLAFHDMGEYNQGATDKMGPDGCLANTTENAGLLEADSEVRVVVVIR